MTKKTIVQEQYDVLNMDPSTGDRVNDILAEAITEVLQVPGVREAVVIHVLNKEIDLDEMGIHEVPFQYLWELLFSTELADQNKGELS